MTAWILLWTNIRINLVVKVLALCSGNVQVPLTKLVPCRTQDIKCSFVKRSTLEVKVTEAPYYGRLHWHGKEPLLLQH